jgi:hypothetical protein
MEVVGRCGKVTRAKLPVCVPEVVLSAEGKSSCELWDKQRPGELPSGQPGVSTSWAGCSAYPPGGRILLHTAIGRLPRRETAPGSFGTNSASYWPRQSRWTSLPGRN